MEMEKNWQIDTEMEIKMVFLGPKWQCPLPITYYPLIMYVII